MNNSIKIRRMAGMAILIAVAIILQFIATYVKFGPLEINLGLIAIAIGGFLYGPLYGMIIGVVVGVVICVSPATIQFFMLFDTVHPWISIIITIVLCLAKTGIAGLVSGYVFKVLKKFNFTFASIASTLLIPIINTGIFIVGVLVYFLPIYGNAGGLFAAIFTTNLLVEVCIVSILSPVIAYLVRILSKNRNLGFSLWWKITDLKLWSGID